MKISNLIKSIEFVTVVGLCVVGVILNEMTWIWALLVAGGYVVVNIFGWANKTFFRTVNPENPRPSGRTVNPENPRPKK